MPTNTTIDSSMLNSRLNPHGHIQAVDDLGFGVRSEIVLPPKTTIRVGSTVISTEDLEMFIRTARKLVNDQYPEELL